MESERERKIRQRAYEIWEESGREEGKADEHWAKAAAELGGTGKAEKSSTAKTKAASPKAESTAAAAAATAKSVKAAPAGRSPDAPAKDASPKG
ncbi:DUF2934 domain-containing protein, partial [Enterovirga sp.]|uniref:DUF2934 domain-containing protein n=1 Tax=Enterovirga sp. TaxID=2026350 RepID=UPI0026336709